MDFDEILDEIGEFGRYQFTNYLLLCFPVFFAAANSLSYVFTAGSPNYRCLVPECDDPKNLVYDRPWVHNTMPGAFDSDGVFTPKQCMMFVESDVRNETNLLQSIQFLNDSCPAEWFTNKEATCNEFVFDNFEKTIVQEWNITCANNEWKLALVGTMHFAGIVVGSGAFGVLADRYGRKVVFIFCIIFMSITGVGQGLAKSYTTFLLFAFLNAIGTSGVYPLAFIIGVEMVGRKKREMSGIILNYFYALGEAAVGLIMWLCRDWMTLQYLVSAPPILFVFYYWLVPESVRWLLAKKRNNRAELIIKKAARINGVVLSETTLATFEEKSDDSDSDLKDKLHEDHEEQNQTWNLFKGIVTSRVLLTRMVILIYNWAVCAFVYYGLSLNATFLSGNKFLNFALVCLIEIPGYSLAWIAMNKIGRRWSLAGSLLLCGVTCITGAFVSGDLTWLVITLFLMGKLGITASFAVIYVHTAEMLPTLIRSGGVGTMSTVARLGAMVAPFVRLLDVYMKALPLLLFGSVAFTGGLLALILPETLGRRLPDTIEEAERLDKENVKKEFS